MKGGRRCVGKGIEAKRGLKRAGGALCCCRCVVKGRNVKRWGRVLVGKGVEGSKRGIALLHVGLDYVEMEGHEARGQWCLEGSFTGRP